jgi:hypothetical protein
LGVVFGQFISLFCWLQKVLRLQKVERKDPNQSESKQAVAQDANLYLTEEEKHHFQNRVPLVWLGETVISVRGGGGYWNYLWIVYYDFVWLTWHWASGLHAVWLVGPN